MIENPDPSDKSTPPVTRGLLSDVHGVLYVYPDPVPGSVDAVRRLERTGFPHLFVTNSTQHAKAWILESLRRVGFDLPPDRVLTAAEVAGDLLRGRGYGRVGWMCVEELAQDLAGFERVRPDGADRNPVDAVLVGDMGTGFTYEVMNRGFRWLLEGAELIALARTRFYQSREGLVLDCGPYVALLEDATGRTAEVAGKPSPAFFRAGLRRLGVSPKEAAMVGDDLQTDVLPAMDLGMRGIQVRTGKFREELYAGSARKADDLVENLEAAVALLQNP